MAAPEKHLHFTEKEFARRKTATLEAMRLAGLDGLLIFRQESMYWLTGFDTGGFVKFQCLYLAANGDLKLLTRPPDVRLANWTSIIPNIRVWRDAEDANPALDLKVLLTESKCQGKTLGVEWESYGLTAYNGRLVDAALAGFCTLVDASFLISKLRLIKSEEELVYVRKAGEQADRGLEEVYRLAHPGAWEGDIFAAMQGEMLKMDGDLPAMDPLFSSGHGSFMGRYFTGRRRIEANDQMLVEYAGSCRHYNVVIMRVMRIGKPVPKQIELWNIGVEALQACQAAARVGRPLGEIYQAFHNVVSKSGYDFQAGAMARPFSIGYSLGATFLPTWMDYPFLYGDNPILIEPNMVLFMHMTLRDDARGFSATPGETIVVKEKSFERLSRMPLDFRVND